MSTLMPPPLAMALARAQIAMQAVEKNANNPESGYDYVTCDRMIAETKAELAREGVALVPIFLGLVEPVKGYLCMGRTFRLVHAETGAQWDVPVQWPTRLGGSDRDKEWAGLDSYSLAFTLRSLLLVARRLPGERQPDDARTNVQSHGTFVQDDPGVVAEVTGPDNEGILDARPGQWLAGFKGRPWADARREAEALDRTTPPLRVEDAPFAPEESTGEGSPALPPAPAVLVGALSTTLQNKSDSDAASVANATHRAAETRAQLPPSETLQGGGSESTLPPPDPSTRCDHVADQSDQDCYVCICGHGTWRHYGRESGADGQCYDCECRSLTRALDSTDSTPHLSTSSPAVETVSAAGGEGLPLCERCGRPLEDHARISGTMFGDGSRRLECPVGPDLVVEEALRRHFVNPATGAPMPPVDPPATACAAPAGEGLAFVSELRADDKAMTEAEDAPLAEPSPGVVSLVASAAEKLAAKLGPPWRGEGPMCCTCGGQHAAAECPLAEASEEEAREAMRIAMEKEAAPAKAEYFRAMNGAMVPVVNYEVGLATQGDPAPRVFLADLTKPVAESGPLADDPAPAPKRRGRPKNRPKVKPEEAA